MQLMMRLYTVERATVVRLPAPPLGTQQQIPLIGIWLPHREQPVLLVPLVLPALKALPVLPVLPVRKVRLVLPVSLDA